MRRRTLGLAGLLLLAGSVLSDPAAAQLGGLTKKARDKAAQAAGVQTTDQPARMAGPAVTTQSVDQLLAGLKVEATATEQRAVAERRRQEREDAERNAETRRRTCMDEQRDKDPAWKEIQRLRDLAAAAAEKGDYAKAGEHAQRINVLTTEMMARIQAVCDRQAREDQAALPTVDQQAMQQATTKPDSVGAKAAGMSLADYAAYKELVYTYLTRNEKAGLTAEEKRVIEPKKTELRARLKAVGIG